MTAVQLQHVEKVFGDQKVLNDINIQIANREFMVFVGPSGCGKSTLLRTIAGLERASAGQILIGEEDVTHLHPARRGVAMVFQSYALYPHMSVYENIAFGLRMAKMPKAEVDKRVRQAADVLQIQNLLDRKPKALSGGQRQRVAIGRSIVRNPKVFLFDEPLSNLDAALRVQMRLELIKLHQRLDATMIYVTHDQVEAMTMADRIVVLNQGRVEQIGTPLELYRQPQNQFVAGFIGSPKMNFLPVDVIGVDSSGVRVRLPASRELTLPVNGKNLDGATNLTLGVRPEHLRERHAGNADAWLPGEVSVVEHLGGETVLHVQLPDGVQLAAKGSGDDERAVNQSIEIGLRAAYCHLFRPDGLALRRLEQGQNISNDESVDDKRPSASAHPVS